MVSYARTRNATRIVLGKPTRSGWQRWLLGSLVDTIVRLSTDMDIHVVGKESEFLSQADGQSLFCPQPLISRACIRRTRLVVQFAPWLLVGGDRDGNLHAIAWLMLGHFDLANLIMVYLLGVVVVAARYGHGPRC
ncbi:MAG: hypothetical protein WDM70_01070 [Nitrosomonadales bacterium]